MRRLAAMLACAATLAVSAVVASTPSSATPRDVPGRACSGSACAVILNGGSDVGVARRGHQLRIVYPVELTGPTTTVTLEVAGEPHLHLTGAATIDDQAAPRGAVTRHGQNVRVSIPVDTGRDARIHQVGVTATVDNTARTDLKSTATVSVTAAGSAPATAHRGMTVLLDRPAVYVGIPVPYRLRAGHHRQEGALLMNTATMTAHTATLWITLPAHVSLNGKWGVSFDNRRVHCTGSGRHYRCAITKMLPNLRDSGLLIDLRAARHAPHGYAGRLTLHAEPTGYDNGSPNDTASTPVRIKG